MTNFVVRQCRVVNGKSTKRYMYEISEPWSEVTGWSKVFRFDNPEFKSWAMESFQHRYKINGTSLKLSSRQDIMMLKLRWG